MLHLVLVLVVLPLINAIERMFGSKTIKLDTPVWNKRTNQFYKKCGFIEIGRDSENVYFEKEQER